MPTVTESQDQRMPTVAVVAVLVASLLPLFLILLGVDFGSAEPLSGSLVANDLDAAYRNVSGAFVHTILEWSAISIAMLTVWLAFLHYREHGELAMPLLGMAWFCAGLIDVAHILGADRLMSVAGSYESFTDFTWLISRITNAGILTLGAALFMLSSPVRSRSKRERETGLVLIMASIATAIAGIAVYLCATRTGLPYSIHSGAFLSRPYELIPLFLYVLVAALIMPEFRKWHPGLFTHALWISLIPHSMAQLHMAIGVETPYDAHYHAAHLLKVIAYGVPMIALAMEYRHAHAGHVRAQEERMGEYFIRQQAEEALATDRNVLRILMDQNRDMIAIKDASLRYTKINDRLARFMGLSNTRDAIGKTDTDFFDAPYAETVRKKDAEALAGGKPVENVPVQGTRQRAESDQDSSFTVFYTSVPLKNTEGNTLGIVTITRTSEERI